VSVNFVFAAIWKTIGYLEKKTGRGFRSISRRRSSRKKRYSYRKLSLLCDALLLLGDTATLKKLEDTLRSERPRQLARLGVRFSSSSLVTGDYARLRALAGELADVKGADRDWLLFMPLSSTLSRKSTIPPPIRLVRSPERFPIRCWLPCAGISRAGCCRGSFPRGAMRSTRRRNPPVGASREIHGEEMVFLYGRCQGGMHVVVLGKMIDETALWLFPSATHKKKDRILHRYGPIVSTVTASGRQSFAVRVFLPTLIVSERIFGALAKFREEREAFFGGFRDTPVDAFLRHRGIAEKHRGDVFCRVREDFPVECVEFVRRREGQPPSRESRQVDEFFHEFVPRGPRIARRVPLGRLRAILVP
jgi:hypothetical protein